MIFPRALWTAGSVLPSDTRCSRKGFSSFSLLRFSTCAPAAQHEHMIAIYQVPHWQHTAVNVLPMMPSDQDFSSEEHTHQW